MELDMNNLKIVPGENGGNVRQRIYWQLMYTV